VLLPFYLRMIVSPFDRAEWSSLCGHSLLVLSLSLPVHTANSTGGFTRARLLFSTAHDGKDMDVLHTKCNKQGPTVTFIRYSSGGVLRVFGAYINIPWDRTAGWRQCPKACLISILSEFDDVPVTVYPVGNPESTVASSAGGGFQFGAAGAIRITEDIPGLLLQHLP
jgi:hypothetical protein